MVLLAELGCEKKSQSGFVPGFVFRVTDTNPAGSARRGNKQRIDSVTWSNRITSCSSLLHGADEFADLFPSSPW